MDRRRPRGTLVAPASLGWVVERANKERFSELAEKAGMSNAAFFDAMVENLVLKEDGLPNWLPTQQKEEELPLK